MGSASSKASRGASLRKYPARAPGAAAQTVSQGVRSGVAPPAQKGDGSMDDAIKADAMDPDFTPGGFSKRLNDMGIVQPNPTFSPSSRASVPFDAMPSSNSGPVFPSAKNNATLSVLESRRRLQQLADQDVENVNRAGKAASRQFLDMRTLVDAMELLGRGHAAQDVEKKLGLQPKLLSKLGKPGVVEHLAVSAPPPSTSSA